VCSCSECVFNRTCIPVKKQSEFFGNICEDYLECDDWNLDGDCTPGKTWYELMEAEIDLEEELELDDIDS
jgi:hypothetical protein